MKSFFKVFKFEFAGYLKGKYFRISTIVITLLVCVVMFFPRFIDMGTNKTNADNISQTSSTIGIYDPSGVFEDDSLLKASFPKAKIIVETNVEDMKKAIKSGELDAGLYMKNEGNYEYLILDSTINDTTEYVLQSVIQTQYHNKTLSEMGLSPEQIAKASVSAIQGNTVILGKDGKQNYLYTYILVFILYFIITFYGQMTASNVASEKGNRSMEILVTSTSSNALIFGKVLAGAAAGILQVAIILGFSILSYQMNAEIWNHSLDFLFNIPVNVLVTFAIFGTLGYLFYSFIYGALGSMVSKLEEVSSAILPIMIIFMISFFLTFFAVMTHPGTILSLIVCYVPFTSCMAMLARVAMGSVEMWQVALSAVILALSTIGIGMISAKLYRHGTLSYGNSFKLKNILHLLKRNK